MLEPEVKIWLPHMSIEATTLLITYTKFQTSRTSNDKNTQRSTIENIIKEKSSMLHSGKGSQTLVTKAVLSSHNPDYAHQLQLYK